MPIHFPITCKLMANERETLNEILSEGESPCEGCAWGASCDGPEMQYKIENMLFDNPDDHCLVCGHPIGLEAHSKLIAGAFRYCSENRDEYTFTPALTAIACSNPDNIEL